MFFDDISNRTIYKFSTKKIIIYVVKILNGEKYILIFYDKFVEVFIFRKWDWSLGRTYREKIALTSTQNFIG